MTITNNSPTKNQEYVWRAAFAVQDKRKRSPRIAEIVDKSGFSLGKVREAISALKALGLVTSEPGRNGTMTFANPRNWKA